MKDKVSILKTKTFSNFLKSIMPIIVSDNYINTKTLVPVSESLKQNTNLFEVKNKLRD